MIVFDGESWYLKREMVWVFGKDIVVLLKLLATD
jgi:hypothetical protein